MAETPAGAVSVRYQFEDGYDNSEDGEWCRLCTNDGNGLMGYESYVMKSLAEMYDLTRDPLYLERLSWHIDGVLSMRDDARQVQDYRGLESPCWRDLFYSQGRPYS